MPSPRQYWKWIAPLLLTVMLVGCAAEKARQEGLTLLDQGHYEEGLAKLEQASKEYPDDLSFRTAIKNNRDMAVNRLLAAAGEEAAGGRLDTAQATYERALRLEPNNTAAEAGLKSLAQKRKHIAVLADAKAMLKKGDTEGADAAVRQVLLEDPEDAEAADVQRQIRDQRARAALAEPALLSTFKKPVNLQFRDANLKMVFEALARTSGINILLDKDVRPDLKTSIFVKNISVEDTIDLILLQDQLEKKVLNENTVFIYPSTPAKKKDFQDLMIRSFHLVNADAKQMQTMLKTILKTKDIFVHEKTNSVVIRDTPDAVRLAEKMIADQDGPDPEVMLEVEVLEITRSALTNIGISFPDQLVLTPTGSSTTTGGTTSTSTLTLHQLQHISNDQILVSSPLALGFNFHSDKGDVNVLASPRIRTKNKEKAKILIGDRVPVITNAVTPVSTGTPVVTGSVQYLDVGIKLDAEPTVMPDRDVSIKLSLEVSSITNQVANPISGTLAYQIGTRTASTVLELKDGETQVLAGLINSQDQHTVNEVPVLGEIPILGRLFSTHKNDTSKSEIVLSITPHIVRPARLPEAGEVEYWSGTETEVRKAPVSLKPIGNVSLSTTPAPAAPAPAPKPAPAPAAKTAAPAAAAEGTMNLSWTGPNQAKVGDRVTLTLNTTSAQAVKSLGLAVTYDPAVLKAVDVGEGSLVTSGDASGAFTKDIQQDTGQIVVDLSTPATGSAATSASITSITFEVVAAAPQTQIIVSRITPAGPGGESLPVSGPGPFSLTLAQ